MYRFSHSKYILHNLKIEYASYSHFFCSCPTSIFIRSLFPNLCTSFIYFSYFVQVLFLIGHINLPCNSVHRTNIWTLQTRQIWSYYCTNWCSTSNGWRGRWNCCYIEEIASCKFHTRFSEFKDCFQISALISVEYTCVYWWCLNLIWFSPVKICLKIYLQSFELNFVNSSVSEAFYIELYVFKIMLLTNLLTIWKSFLWHHLQYVPS